MKAAVFNQYLDTLGGGERYTLTFALVLKSLGYAVDVTWQDPSIRELVNDKIDFSIKERLEDRFGLDLEGINFVKDIKRGDGYDLCFWVSDGSIPTLRARKNLLHFQVPFHHLGSNNLLNKMKLIRVDKIICNSFFTKKIIDQEYGVESVVVYPPVPVDQIKSKRKENIILSVGRFSQLKQSKHQDVLIKAFKKLVDGGFNDWKLILAGGVEVGVDDYVDKLKKMANGYPVEIYKSPPFDVIKDLYGKAKIFWSASGYGEDEMKNPEKVEHFGIAVVESMATGAVPVVFKAGGHKEIIDDKVNGFLWETTANLVNITKSLLGKRKLLRKASLAAKDKSHSYSEHRFKEEIVSLL